jgi:SAM-dependent methyltransferase
MQDKDAAYWEDLARREPYFPVLTSEGHSEVASNSVATSEFFKTGEADIAALLAAMSSLLGREIHPKSTLDFGCGAGRLTLPLARISTRVVACDIAPTILEHARQNLERAELHNVTLLSNDELNALPDSQFDFAVCLLVFEHIPPPAGYPLIGTILRLLVPFGLAALHVPFERPRGLRRYARFVRGSSRGRPTGGIRQSAGGLSFMQKNEYDEGRLIGNIEASGARLAGCFATPHGDTAGAVLIIEKLPVAPPSSESLASSAD